MKKTLLIAVLIGLYACVHGQKMNPPVLTKNTDSNGFKIEMQVGGPANEMITYSWIFPGELTLEGVNNHTLRAISNKKIALMKDTGDLYFKFPVFLLQIEAKSVEIKTVFFKD